MADVNKHQAVIDFISNCPQIRDNPLYFNFINAKDENKEIMTHSTDTPMGKPFIDGSVQKRYTFTLIDYKSITYNPVVKAPGYVNENVEDILDTEAIIEWVKEQADDRNFPDFGEDCQIDDMIVTTDIPNLNGIDKAISPVLAQYSFTVWIDYIDNSKKLWR